MTAGFGDFDLSCPKNATGHEWTSAAVDVQRPCIHCRTRGRGQDADSKDVGFLHDASAARSAFFGTLQSPLSSNGKAMKR